MFASVVGVSLRLAGFTLIRILHAFQDAFLVLFHAICFFHAGEQRKSSLGARGGLYVYGDGETEKEHINMTAQLGCHVASVQLAQSPDYYFAYHNETKQPFQS